MHSLKNMMLKLTRKSKNNYNPCYSRSHIFHPNRVNSPRYSQLMITSLRTCATTTKLAPSLTHKEQKMKIYTKINLTNSKPKYISQSTYKCYSKFKKILSFMTNLQLISSNVHFLCHHISIPVHQISPKIYP